MSVKSWFARTAFAVAWGIAVSTWLVAGSPDEEVRSTTATASAGVELAWSSLQREDGPQIWPAATEVEWYTPDTDLLRTVHPHELAFEYDKGKDEDRYKDIQPILDAATDRFMHALVNNVPNQPHDFPINPDKKALWPIRVIQIRINNPHVARLSSTTDESYTIHVPPVIDNEPFIFLSSETVYGALHGLQSLLQLLEFGWLETKAVSNEHFADTVTNTFLLRQTPLRIEDRPTYSYRGLLVDTARHYLPLDLILTNLDAMAMNKMNVLHWHLTDSQSFPWRSRSFPELSEHGAFCKRCIYTNADIEQVVHQAALRGIHVVVEIDLPGHCQAIGLSHPELLSECSTDSSNDASPWTSTSVGPIASSTVRRTTRTDPASSWLLRRHNKAQLMSSTKRSEPLDVTEDAVLNFTATLYQEAGTLWPAPWVHVGGDEVSLRCWQNSSKIHDWMKQHNMTHEVQVLQYYERFLINMATEQLHKRPIVWQEVFDESNGLNLPNTTIIDFWKGGYPENVRRATLLNFDVVVSACWYLDHLVEDWVRYYECNPRNFNGTVAQQQRVLGGHASMWGERVDDNNFFPRVWPRASAVAEKLWTGERAAAKASSGFRLNRFRCFMIRQGIPTSPIYPGQPCE